ncbi:hypothetical protein SAMN06296241_0370 [Salinimicrobium sediminis]|uniref:Uncharacterized protein n=1 Tax=Salinimicrobium sediminis TaxID=1343891 RepID=A0A285X0I6_9FLAO|nr:hypothetical protein SAMN06296241_0370 [Salinimicrobium sediminis]
MFRFDIYIYTIPFAHTLVSICETKNDIKKH